MAAKSNEQPHAAPSQPAQNGFSLISNDKLLQLYSTMLKSRMMAERIRILFKQNNFSANGSLVVGHEAAAVGVAIDLAPEDTVAPPPGDLIPCFINGLPLEKLFGGLFHPLAPSPGIAARLKIAADAAMANKLNKNNKISVAFSTGEPASLGPWHQALSFAGLHGLPMIFVSWMKSIPLKTKACGFPAITVDGNDAVAVYRVASEAIAHARKGNGPTLIECQRWKAGDPILTMEKYLICKGLFSEGYKAEVAAAFNKELDAAIETAKKLSLHPGQPNDRVWV